jgi:tetratricopeptide (TPR) repeat protein
VTASAAPKKRPSKRAALDPDELAALEEQRDFLLRSLADLDREHDAGDLEDEDYQTLRDDYTARAADVLRAIDDQRAAFDAARSPRSLGRTLGWAAAVAVFAIVSGIAVAGALGARKAGETSSGGVTVAQTSTQRANECIPKINQAPDEANECFEAILKEDPKNVVALTWSAWLLSLVSENVEGVDQRTYQALAAVRLDDAVESDPDYSYARAFRAIVAYRNGRYQDAQQYLQEFKDNDPAADAVGIMEQMDLEANLAAALAEEGAASTTTAPENPSTTVAGG